VTVTFTSLQPPGTTVLGATGTNALGQPYIVFNVTVPPVTGIANYGSLLYLAPSMPTVTFTTSASLSPGLGFNIYSTNFVQITRKQFQGDGSFLLNFLSSTNYYYYVQYSSDLVTWFTSPLAIHGSGTQLQWVDLGPNITVLAPRTAPYRFYRVVSH
jgi:hypothetical protein